MKIKVCPVIDLWVTGNYLHDVLQTFKSCLLSSVILSTFSLHGKQHVFSFLMMYYFLTFGAIIITLKLSIS